MVDKSRVYIRNILLTLFMSFAINYMRLGDQNELFHVVSFSLTLLCILNVLLLGKHQYDLNLDEKNRKARIVTSDDILKDMTDFHKAVFEALILNNENYNPFYDITAQLMLADLSDYFRAEDLEESLDQIVEFNKSVIAGNKTYIQHWKLINAYEPDIKHSELFIKLLQEDGLNSLSDYLKKCITHYGIKKQEEK